MQNLNLEKEFRLSPLSFSWVALHPNPKGVVLFIGGIFFGSLPHIFYKHLLKQIYLDGYTVVALPFRFTLRHWSVAVSLLQEQEKLTSLLAQRAKELSYNTNIYRESSCYQWLGHSLGCKYIALLEFLAEWNENSEHVRNQIKKNTKRPQVQIQQIEQSLLDLSISFKDQKSILMAPEISNTEDAVKIPLLPLLLDNLGLGVIPTKQETFDLIKQSNLFNLTKMVSFKDDKIAGSKLVPDKTVGKLLKILASKLLHQEVEGKHLRPLGLEIGRKIIGPIASPPRQLIPLLFNFLK